MHLNQGTISIFLSFCLVSPQGWIQPGCACSATRVQTGLTKVCTCIAKSIIFYTWRKHGRRYTYQLKSLSWITVCHSLAPSQNLMWGFSKFATLASFSRDPVKPGSVTKKVYFLQPWRYPQRCSWMTLYLKQLILSELFWFLDTSDRALAWCKISSFCKLRL